MTTADPRTAPPHPNLLRTVPYSRARAPTTWDPRHAGTTTAAPRRRRAARAPPPSSCATPARAATCARCSGCCTAATSTPTRSVRPAPHRPTPASCAAPPHTCFLCRTAPHLLPVLLPRPSGRLYPPSISPSPASPTRATTTSAPRRTSPPPRGAGRPSASSWRRAAPTPTRSIGAAARSNTWPSWRCHVWGPSAPQTGSGGLGLPSARLRGGRAPQIPPRGHVPGTSPPSTIPIHTASGHPRWGGTPLDDAMRSKHALVANYLRTKGGLSGQEIRSRAEAETRGSGWFR